MSRQLGKASRAAQHTAGCHGTQWRHLMQDRRITDRFQLIAYDLPFHGKSVPPTERQWWAEPYQLTGEFLRAVPLALSRVLGLDRPVFMGCSVGGLLALDLAHKHPDAFGPSFPLKARSYWRTHGFFGAAVAPPDR